MRQRPGEQTPQDELAAAVAPQCRVDSILRLGTRGSRFIRKEQQGLRQALSGAHGSKDAGCQQQAAGQRIGWQPTGLAGRCPAANSLGARRRGGWW